MRIRRRKVSLEAGPTAAVLAAILGMDLGATVAVVVLLKRLSRPVDHVSEVTGAIAEAV
jgi:hypothetical protein